jgi:hypothetical protein
MEDLIMSKAINIQKILEKKCTGKVMSHELNRFNQMSDKELHTRLDKIINPVKLEAFRYTAKYFHKPRLARLAQIKRDICFDVMALEQ